MIEWKLRAGSAAAMPRCCTPTPVLVSTRRYRVWSAANSLVMDRRRSLSTASLAGLALLLCSPLVLSAPLRPPPLAQKGNACLPTSAAMALHSLGEPTTARDIARRLPFHKDGTDFFDLQEELSRRGFASLMFTAGPDAIAAAVQAGYPVIAAVKAAGTKHAVLVWGLGGAASEPSLRYVDPRGGLDKDERLSSFAQQQYAKQLLVIWHASQPAEAQLTEAGFPLEAARRTNARFRAEALVLRAERHPAPNSQMLELLRRAVKEDPSWQAARVKLLEVQRVVAGP